MDTVEIDISQGIFAQKILQHLEFYLDCRSYFFAEMFIIRLNIA